LGFLGGLKVWKLEFQNMPQSRSWFFQNTARRIQTGGAVSIALRFIWVALSYEQVVTRFHLLGLDPYIAS
jgi:hypothetical protein